MNKKFSKLLTAGLAAVMLATSAVSVSAAGTNYDTNIGTATGISKVTTFDKYLVMEEGANVPNVEFAFSIAPGSAIAYDTDEGTFQVLAGITGTSGGPTITWDQYHLDSDEDGPDTDVKSTVRFTSSDTTILAANKGDTDYVKDLVAGKKYVKHTATVDFSDVVFPEPGVYRYVITETDPNLAGIVCDANLYRYLDVYVTDASDATTKKLEIAGYVLHATADSIDRSEDFGTDGTTGSDATSGALAAAGTAASDYKSQGFTNKFVSHDLSFSKTVTGNQGSRDKYFKFTVTISGALPNTKYTVSLDDDSNAYTTDGVKADATVPENAATDSDYYGESNLTEIVTNANGSGTYVFYLQHGQTIAIRGLGEGTIWTIEETPEDYKVSDVDVSGDSTADVDDSNDAKVVSEGIDADTVVAYTNTRDGVVPTGVLLVVAPFAAMALAGLAGIIVIASKKRKNTDA